MRGMKSQEGETHGRWKDGGGGWREGLVARGKGGGRGLEGASHREADET